MSDALQLDEDNELEQDMEKLQGNLEKAAEALHRKGRVGHKQRTPRICRIC